MRKLIVFIIFCCCVLIAESSLAMLNLELTRGVAGAIPIGLRPFDVQGDTPSEDISSIVRNDLQNSGRFKVLSSGQGVDNLVTGKIESQGLGRYRVSFQLQEIFKNKTSNQPTVLLTKTYTVSTNELRAVAHHISDLIYQQLLGVRGVFSTRLAYVVVQRPQNAQARYILEVSDQDGYNPRPLLTSSDPIMSPTWSPNGRQIAYVSFENRHAAIYIEDVATGSRRLVSEFPGINGAPAWSPDGRKLSLVLSKTGSPNIYVMDLANQQLSQMTHDFAINTEPSWAPNGRSIIFTSTRGGTPQIYQMNLATHAVTRLTYDGNYNARGSFAHDGNHLVMINREANLYNIGIMDLDTGVFRALTTQSGTDNASPSIAPNGSMILYDTVYQGRNVLAMVATDGSIQLRLPARNGEAQDPAWSPFLS